MKMPSSEPSRALEAGTRQQYSTMLKLVFGPSQPQTYEASADARQYQGSPAKLVIGWSQIPHSSKEPIE